MFKVAICDDDKNYRRIVKETVRRYSSNIGEIVFDEYSSGEELLADIYQMHNLLFLDIQMAEMDGNEAAKEFRTANKSAVLVFCTNYQEPTTESFKGWRACPGMRCAASAGGMAWRGRRRRTGSLQRFIDKVKCITQLTELTPEVVHEFIEKIVVSKPEYIDGKRHQNLKIYYNGVGIVREPSPEEMEELFQEHMQNRKSRKSSKTA